MEALINKLLAGDLNLIQTTNKILEIQKNPDTINELIEIVSSNRSTAVRHSAALFLEKHVLKAKTWNELPVEKKQLMKSFIFNALISEQETKVRYKLADVCATMLLHEFVSSHAWVQETMESLFNYITSSDELTMERGVLILSLLTGSVPKIFSGYMPALADMFIAAVTAAEAKNFTKIQVLLDIIKSFTYLMPHSVGNTVAERNYQHLVSTIARMLPVLSDPARETEEFDVAFDFLEGVIDSMPKLLNSCLKQIVEIGLNISMNQQVPIEKRIRTVAFLGSLIQIKKSMLVKLNLIEPMIQVMFQLLQSPLEEGEDIDDDCNTIVSIAEQTMDLLALHIPTDKVFPPLMKLLAPALQSEDLLSKRAAFHTMAAIAEGCSNIICQKYLDLMINIIKAGITHEVISIRNAAFYCLAQFSEYLQPDFSKYADLILPILFEYLQAACNDPRNKDPKLSEMGNGHERKQQERMFNALEVFCENLNADELEPHLPILMEKLFQAMDPRNVPIIREMAMNTISSVVVASKDKFMPYFLPLIEILRIYFVESKDEDIANLREHAVDTLSSVAFNIGSENFLPIAETTIEFALKLIEVSTDPDDKRALYALLGVLTDLYPEHMSTVLPKLIEVLYDSILSVEEISAHCVDDDDNTDLTAEIDITDTDDEDDDDDDMFDVEDSYMAEKEEAIRTLAGFAEKCYPAFMPYQDDAFQNIYKMLDHPCDGVRSSAVESVGIVIVAMGKNVGISGPILTLLNCVMTKLDRMLREEHQEEVPVRCAEAFNKILSEARIPVEITKQQYMQLVINIVKDVLQRKIKCQYSDNTVVEDDDEEDATYEFTLIECAGDLLPALGRALGPENYYVIFESFLPLLLQRLKKSKNAEEGSSFNQFFVIGILSDSFKLLACFTSNYFEQFLPIFLRLINNKCARVRQNVFFGLGELMLHSGENSYHAFPQVLLALSEAIAKERNRSVLDNICSTIARLIIANKDLVPLTDVLTALFQYLPIKKDLNENETLVQCWKLLYLNAREIFLSFFDHIVLLNLQILAKKEYEDAEIKTSIMELLQEVYNTYGDKFNAILAQYPDYKAVIEK